MAEFRACVSPGLCIDARHAKAALKKQIDKSDRNDAIGIARIMQTGWYREVRVEARETIIQQIADLDRKVPRLARHDAQIQRFMTTPGVGAITALCYLATIDDPTCFKKSRSVGAYLGLTTRRFASGEIDWTGRISKCGDAMLRCYLYEAANVLLTRVESWSILKAWGMRLAKRSGIRDEAIGCGLDAGVGMRRLDRFEPLDVRFVVALDR